MMSAQFIRWTNPNQFITSGSLGVMGVGLPYAIGVQIANPNKTVIDIDGDGSFNHTLADLQTVFKYKTDVKNAYTTFLATPNITVTPVVSAAPGTSIGSVANSGTSTNTLQTAIDNYNTALSNARITLNSINTQITTNATSLNALVKEIIPIGNSNRAKIDAGVEKLLAKI